MASHGKSKEIALGLLVSCFIVATVAIAVLTSTRMPPSESVGTVAYLRPTVTKSGKVIYYVDSDMRQAIDYDPKTGAQNLYASTRLNVRPSGFDDSQQTWIGDEFDGERSQLVRLSEELRVLGKMLPSSFSDRSPTIISKNQVLFVRAARPYANGFGGKDWTDKDIYLLDLSRQTAIRLTSLAAADVSTPSMAPDGRKVAFSARAHFGSPDIFLLDMNTRVLRRLTMGRDRTNSYPAFSRDGSRLAFVSDRVRPFAYEIWIMKPDGGEPVQLTRLGRRCGLPIFLPGDTGVMFTVDESELWRINLDGSGLARLE